MIRKLKFKHELIYAKTLGTLLALKITQTWDNSRPLPDSIIPVPLHELRLKERGFNQALEIGRHTARMLNVPIDCHSVVRVKPTLAQSGLTKAERQKNMRGAFASRERYDGLNLVILDDVVTTGQTAAELQHLLLRQGAKRVDIWCCARA